MEKVLIRHLEIFLHTQENIRNTQLCFVFLNFSFVCQNISTCLKLNSPRLAIVYGYISQSYRVNRKLRSDTV